ncbi:hypothetical protein ACETRX_18375 [Labrys portucalensis]|uniref:Uncharacterized protein n=1 Tax=Labrys neptuniae TaxID=376174 RepID=A0ABV6ZHD0_9HYPH
MSLHILGWKGKKMPVLPEPMTVADLIDLLREQDPKALVTIGNPNTGPDCAGALFDGFVRPQGKSFRHMPWSQVQHEGYLPAVVLERFVRRK